MAACYNLITFLFVTTITTADELPFDGVVRMQPDGTSIAYMNPVTGISNHASFIEKYPNGDLGAAWFSGLKEEANNCSIAYSRLPANSTQWILPKVIARREGYSNQNPVLFYDTNTSILHCFFSQLLAKSGEAYSTIWHLQSSDYGDKWTEATLLFDEWGSFTRNRIIWNLKSQLLFPIYNATETGKHPGDIPIIATSNCSDTMDLGNRSCWVLNNIPNAPHLVQPSLVRLTGPYYPQIKAFFRDRRKHAIYTSISKDDGVTWETPYAMALPNPNIAIQAYVLSPNQYNNNNLNSTILLEFNDYSGENYITGRTPLSSVLSWDGNGTYWMNTKMLQVHNDNESSLITCNQNSICEYREVEFSYPSLLQTKDGWIHTVYTYNRQTIKYLKYNLTWAIKG